MVFKETIRISMMFRLFFFQQGTDTHTVLHIIDNNELKLDCKLKKNAISVKEIAIRYFPQIAPLVVTRCTNSSFNPLLVKLSQVFELRLYN